MLLGDVTIDSTLWIELAKLLVHSAVSICVLYVLFHLVTRTMPEVVKELTSLWTNAAQQQTRLYSEMTVHQNALQQSLVQTMAQQMTSQTQAIMALEKQIELQNKAITDMQQSWKPQGRRKEDSGP